MEKKTKTIGLTPKMKQVRDMYVKEQLKLQLGYLKSAEKTLKKYAEYLLKETNPKNVLELMDDFSISALETYEDIDFNYRENAKTRKIHSDFEKLVKNK